MQYSVFIRSAHADLRCYASACCPAVTQTFGFLDRIGIFCVDIVISECDLSECPGLSGRCDRYFSCAFRRHRGFAVFLQRKFDTSAVRPGGVLSQCFPDFQPRLSRCAEGVRDRVLLRFICYCRMQYTVFIRFAHADRHGHLTA